MGKRSKKNQKRHRQKDWAPTADENVDMDDGDANSANHRKHNRKQEKLSKSTKAGANPIIRKSILNAITMLRIDDDDEDMTGDVAANAAATNAKAAANVAKAAKAATKSNPNRVKRKDDFNVRYRLNHMFGGISWHKVRIVGAAKYDKVFLFDQLSKNLRVRVVPICLSVEDKDWVFLVDSYDVARSLKSKNRVAFGESIGVSDKFNIKVTDSPPAPNPSVTPELGEIIANVIIERYRPETRSLDLSRFQEDVRFINESVFVSLTRISVASKVVEIIEKNFPELEALNLSNNKLPRFRHFFRLLEVCENLKIIHLNNNLLWEVEELGILDFSRVEELNLAGNSFFKKYRFPKHVMKAVQMVLPSLKFMDGQKLISPEEEQMGAFMLPESVKKNAIEAKEQVIVNFVKQYFEAYDGDDRRVLSAAYHEEAFFSLSSSYPTRTMIQVGLRLSSYLDLSRNLKKDKKGRKRDRHLKHGREEIVAFLSDDLPRTMHNLNSFTLDMDLATDNVVKFTVSGTFHDRKNGRVRPMGDTVRHFARTFFVVSRNGGLVIANEMFHITLATRHQSKDHLFTLGLLPPSSDLNTIAMIQELSSRTNMKFDWSKRCLTESNWNMEAAFNLFDAALKEGRIPPEAFN